MRYTPGRRGGRRPRYGGRRPPDSRAQRHSGERGRYGAPRKNNTPLIIGGVGVVIVIIIIAVLASGGGASASTPQDACLSYFRAIRAKDPETAYRLLSTRFKRAFENFIRSLSAEEKSSVCVVLESTPDEVDRMTARDIFVSLFHKSSDIFDEAGLFDIIGEFEIGKAVIIGRNATVKVYMRGSDEGEPVQLVRESDGWKLDVKPPGG